MSKPEWLEKEAKEMEAWLDLMKDDLLEHFKRFGLKFELDLATSPHYENRVLASIDRPKEVVMYIGLHHLHSGKTGMIEYLNRAINRIYRRDLKALGYNVDDIIELHDALIKNRENHDNTN